MTEPTGVGSRSIEVIRDGDSPPAGSLDRQRMYDTYDGINDAAYDWIGYVYSGSVVWEEMLFQEGLQFSNGGWFDTLTVEVRQGGSWVDVTGLTITPEYPFSDTGLKYETYQLTFDPMLGDGIRLLGAPGGEAAFISVAELSVFGGCEPPPSVVASCDNDVTDGGQIFALVTSPSGGGNLDFGVIRDGDMPEPGDTDPLRHYDSFDGFNPALNDWIGYVYPETHAFQDVIFQEGLQFADGGWFETLTVQVRQGGSWVEVTGLTISPAYAFGDNGLSYETYLLTFDPLYGDGIRIFGVPGGAAAFISVAELLVFADCQTPSFRPPQPPSNCEDLTYDGDIIARVTAPSGAANPDIEVIRDGDTPDPSEFDLLRMYDTFNGGEPASEDWIGYVYDSVHVWEAVLFQEGLHFADGGWFDTLTVQVRLGENWLTVTGLRITPGYAYGDNGIPYETYILMFDPLPGTGIRIFGAPGGEAAFISVSELNVFGDCY